MPKIFFQIAVILLLGQFVSPAKAKIMIFVDIDNQRMKVTNNNGATFWWTISSGRDGFETPTGSFSVQRLDANHFSDEYDQAPMPYAIFFMRASPSTALIRAVSGASCIAWLRPFGGPQRALALFLGRTIWRFDRHQRRDERRRLFYGRHIGERAADIATNRSWITIFPPD